MNFGTIIIGAGLSGLSAARTLVEHRRHDFIVLEKGNLPGGRVQTIEQEGYHLDLGFQVGLSSYPAFTSILPIKELRPCYFGSGALVEEKEGELNQLAHPLFHPGRIGSAITSKISISDRARLVSLTVSCLVRSDRALLKPSGLTTDLYLKERGFSDHILSCFFRPFFGSIFLNDELETDSSLFCYYLKQFTRGRAFVPGGGVSRMGGVLAGKLGGDKIRYNSEVEKIESSHQGVKVFLKGSPTPLTAKKLILAADPKTTSQLLGWPKPEFRSTKVVYLRSSRSLYDGPWIVLPSVENRLAQHFVQITNIDPSLAPPGMNLISATILDDRGLAEKETVAKVVSEIKRLFPETALDLSLLKVISVPQALPVQSPEQLASLRSLPVPDSTLLAGDLVSNASLQNALQSGRNAALKAMNRL